MAEDKFQIIDCGKYITIANVNGCRRNHCHLTKSRNRNKNTLDTAHMLVRLMNSKRVPRSRYLQECVLRISIDDDYINKVYEVYSKKWR